MNALSPTSLAELSSDALTTRIVDLLGHERRCIVDFLWHLAELDKRGTVLDLGFPSLFAYCTDALRLSKPSAWRRTTSARLLARFPAAAEYLADGRLCLSTFVLLRKVLEPENHRELIERAAGRSEEEVERLVAGLCPKPEVKDSIRRLPTPAPARAHSSGSGPELSLDIPLPSAPLAPSAERSGSGPELRLNSSIELEARPEPVASVPVSPRRPRMEPVDAERYSLKMTVSAEFMAELAEVKAALSHLVPDGDLEAVLRTCFRKTLEQCAKRKHGGGAKPGPDQASTATVPPGDGPEPDEGKPDSRHIPIAVRRQVWARDGGACAFVGSNGRRCGSKHQLEFDHIRPFAEDGPPTVENLRVVCRAHNLHAARKHFGSRFMARFARPSATVSAPVRRDRRNEPAPPDPR